MHFLSSRHLDLGFQHLQLSLKHSHRCSPFAEGLAHLGVPLDDGKGTSQACLALSEPTAHFWAGMGCPTEMGTLRFLLPPLILLFLKSEFPLLLLQPPKFNLSCHSFLQNKLYMLNPRLWVGHSWKAQAKQCEGRIGQEYGSLEMKTGLEDKK